MLYYLKCILINQKHNWALDCHIQFYSSSVHQKLACSDVIKTFQERQKSEFIAIFIVFKNAFKCLVMADAIKYCHKWFSYSKHYGALWYVSSKAHIIMWEKQRSYLYYFMNSV